MKRWHVLAAAAFVAGCTENLPTGPQSFAASVRIVMPHDTVVVGDSSTGTAQATDASGNLIQSLTFKWTISDSTTLGGATGPSADAAAGRVRTFIGRKPGHATVTTFLADPRFAAQTNSRAISVVVGGVRVLSSRDTTLAAINDTGTAIAAGLVRVNGALVPRASQGIRWTHLGSRTTVVGQGDTIRFVAKSNGADTLIATSDLCLAGAKCADTVIARVNQQLFIAVAPRTLTAFSFGDSVAPAVTLADRRGNGLAGTTVRFVPLTAADSAIVRTTPVIGTSNFTTGAMAVPRLVASGNGTARVAVQGIGADGSTVLAADTITITVRQVVRFVNAEALRAVMSVIDSIPVVGVARDARGAAISDAVVTLSANGTTLHGVWAGPNNINAISTSATITPTSSGVAQPENNPQAPQIPPIVNSSLINITKVDTLGADTAHVTYNFTVLDSLAQPAAGSWVRFSAQGGGAPDSVQVNASGIASVTWNARTSTGTYTLTGVRSASSLATLGDSTGRIVLRRTMVVQPGKPAASRSSVAMSSTTVVHGGTSTITITLVDQFGNPATKGTTSDFTLSALAGAITGLSCTNGTCTATYTAGPGAGTDQLTVQIGGVDVLNSPIVITIT